MGIQETLSTVVAGGRSRWRRFWFMVAQWQPRHVFRRLWVLRYAFGRQALQKATRLSRPALQFLPPRKWELAGLRPRYGLAIAGFQWHERRSGRNAGRLDGRGTRARTAERLRNSHTS